MPRRVATGVDPKRLAMIVAVLSRHAGIALGTADVFVNVAGGVRIDEPGADLAVALAIASAARGRAGAGRHRRLRRDRPHGPSAAGGAGRAAARGVREARSHDGDRTRRDDGQPRVTRRRSQGDAGRGRCGRRSQQVSSGALPRRSRRRPGRTAGTAGLRPRARWPRARRESAAVVRCRHVQFGSIALQISARMMFPRRQPLSAGGFREMGG